MAAFEHGPGIHHIEYWVRELARSTAFFDAWLPLVGWYKLGVSAYSSGHAEIYLIEKPGVERTEAAGPRHLCFHASDRSAVDEVAFRLRDGGYRVLRGPLERPDYSEGYYTVDFCDPDGYMLEVAVSPNMRF